MKRLLTAAVCLGILLRILMVLNARAIGSDGTHYARIATELRAGTIEQASTHVFPPFYPALIVPFAELSGDVELAGRIVAALCGILLILPVGLLAKEIFGPRVGVFTACVLALHPEVLRRSAEVRSETAAALLALWAVYLGWTGFARRSPWRYALLGPLLGAAYLTRPEMAGFLGLIGFWTLAAALRRRPGEFWKHVAFLLVASLLFVAVAFPYMYILKTDSGKWQISRKPFYEGDSALQIVGTMAWEKIKHIGSDLFVKFPGSISYFLFAFLLLGLSYRRLVPRNGWGEFYLLLFVVAFMLILPPGHARFFFTIGILSIPFAVAGMIEAVALVDRYANSRKWTRACVVILGVGMLAAGVSRAAKPINVKRVVEKDAGYAIRYYAIEHGIHGFVVHGIMPQAAHYSGGEFARLNESDYTSLTELLLKKKNGEKVSETMLTEAAKEDYEEFLNDVSKLHGEKQLPILLLVNLRTARKELPWLTTLVSEDKAHFREVVKPIHDNYKKKNRILVYRYEPDPSAP